MSRQFFLTMRRAEICELRQDVVRLQGPKVVGLQRHFVRLSLSGALGQVYAAVQNLLQLQLLRI